MTVHIVDPMDPCDPVGESVRREVLGGLSRARIILDEMTRSVAAGATPSIARDERMRNVIAMRIGPATLRIAEHVGDGPIRPLLLSVLDDGAVVATLKVEHADRRPEGTGDAGIAMAGLKAVPAAFAAAAHGYDDEAAETLRSFGIALSASTGRPVEVFAPDPWACGLVLVAGIEWRAASAVAERVLPRCIGATFDCIVSPIMRCGRAWMLIEPTSDAADALRCIDRWRDALHGIKPRDPTPSGRAG